MIYIFHRNDDGKKTFYPVELKDDDEALQSAILNEGTILVTRVDDTIVFESFGHEFEPILVEIEAAFIERAEMHYIMGRTNFTPISLRAAFRIFTDILLDQMYARQKGDSMNMDTILRMTGEMSKKLYEIVEEYAEIDMGELQAEAGYKPVREN